MKRHERRDLILRLRAASVAWQRADREIEAMTRQRARVDAFVRELWEEPGEIESPDDVPRVMGEVWKRVTERLPDSGVRETVEFADAAERESKARQAIYYAEFVEALKRLRMRRPSGVEHALIWLEANPICFRSGYTKQRIMRYLRHVPLTPDEHEQLRVALLTAVREGAGVEFRDYCRTARIVDTDDFCRELAGVRGDENRPQAAQRAGWMLDALIRGNGDPAPPSENRQSPLSRSRQSGGR